MARLTLTRRSDGLIYHFTQVGTHLGRPSFARDDAAHLRIAWHSSWGWSAHDPATGALTGLLWGQPPDSQIEPQGMWVSQKGDKSYTYDLTFHP